MSDQEQEQTQTPPEGDPAPPSVEPLSPPEPTQAPLEPVGQTPEAVAGEPPSDADQGVGVAPTEPGDAGEGNPGTHFRPSSDFEQAEGDNTDDVAEAI